MPKRQMTLCEQVEKADGLDSFIKEFLINLNRCPELQSSQFYANPESRSALITRVSKILASEADLSFDEDLMKNLPVNSDDPQFLASEVFRETLVGVGIDEETANNARKMFLAIKRDKFEETQMSFMKAVSILQNDDSSL